MPKAPTLGTRLVSEDFIRERGADIERITSAAVLRHTYATREYWEANKDEIKNEIRLRVWMHYDPSRGGLANFIYNIVPNVVRQMLKKNARDMQHRWTFDEGERAEDEPSAALLRAYSTDGGIDEAIENVFVSQFEERLTEKQRATLVGKRLGFFDRELGDMFDTCRQAQNQNIDKVRKKFEQFTRTTLAERRTA